MKRIICIVFLITLFPFWFKNSFAQNLNLERSYSSNIFSPYDIYSLDENRLITVELTNKYGVLNILDLSKGEITASQPAGRGPGELAQKGKKFITKTKDNNIWVWDNGRRRGFLYDNNLNYISDIISEDRSVTDAIYLNDTTVVVRKMFSSNSVLCLNKFKDRRIFGESFHCLPSYFNENIRSIRNNPLLNQGAMMSFDGKVYVGFDFTSTIFSIDEESNIDTLSTPYYVPFPMEHKNNGNTFEAPDHGEYPLTTIDVGSNSKYVFVLYSGLKFESNLIKQFTGYITGKLAHQMEKSENTFSLYVFERKTGNFFKKIQLDNMAKRVFATDNYVLTLSYMNKEYKVNKYTFE